jgi:hypothetical protein
LVLAAAPNVAIHAVEADHPSIAMVERAHPGATDYWNDNLSCAACLNPLAAGNKSAIDGVSTSLS